MRLDLSDINNLTTDLGRAGPRVALLASRVVARTALQVEATAKELVPVDEGTLRNSISSDIGPLRAVVGPTAFYGHFLEHGTAHMAPRPYMGPALDRHSPGFYAAMETAAGQALG